jgi:hypothetical protein
MRVAQDRNFVTRSGKSASAVLRNSPCRTRGTLKTASAEERSVAFLGVALSPSSVHGRCAAQLRPISGTLRASFSELRRGHLPDDDRLSSFDA